MPSFAWNTDVCRSEEHTSELQSLTNLVCRLLLEKSAQLHLLPYAGASRKVDGIRVRLVGQYPKHHWGIADGAGGELLDYSVDFFFTECAPPEFKPFPLPDLSPF